MWRRIPLVVIFVIFFSLFISLNAQSVMWEETFETDLGTWTLGQNWSVIDGALTMNWSPQMVNYDVSAVSPLITLPANADDLVITQFYDDYSTDTGEYADIIVIHGGTETVLWTWDTTSNDDWGVTGGEDLILSLAPYAGQTVQLKFRSYGADSFNINYWYIYNVKIMVSIPHDLAAVSITGNTTPTQGTANPYVITIRNCGTNAEANYTIKLFNATGTELVSVPGTTLAPGTTREYILNWNPAAEGPFSIYGKVVLTGDCTPQNDQTPVMSVIVQNQQVIAITPHNGTATTNNIPLDFYYKNSISETIWPSAELNIGGLMTGIAYYNNFPVDNLMAMPTKIWVGETAQTDLTDGWIPSTQLTQVFDGVVDYPSGNNIIMIPFTVPYPYTGGNLVVMVNRPMDDEYYSSADVFYYTETPDVPNRTLLRYSDTEEFDPANPPVTATVNNWVPNATFFLGAPNMGIITGHVYETDSNPPVGIEGATVKILENNRTVLTNADGLYTFNYVSPGSYTLQGSKHGYLNSQTYSVDMPVTTVTQDIFIQPEPVVSVSGHVVGNDQPSVGLSDCVITITGYETYVDTTNASGDFVINNVYANHDYTLNVSHAGYTSYTQALSVGADNINLPLIVLNEGAFPPSWVHAELVENSCVVTWGFAANKTGSSEELVIEKELNAHRANNSVKEDQINESYRTIDHFTIYRLLEGQQNDYNAWTVLISNFPPTGMHFIDMLSGLSAGQYLYAIRVHYTNGTVSPPAFSNVISFEMTTIVTVNVSTNTGDDLNDAIITLTNTIGDPDLVYTMTANGPSPVTLEFPSVWRGFYNITGTMPGYLLPPQNNVSILSPSTFNVVFLQVAQPPYNVTATIVNDQYVHVEWTLNNNALGRISSDHKIIQELTSFRDSKTPDMIRDNSHRDTAHDNVRNTFKVFRLLQGQPESQWVTLGNIADESITFFDDFTWPTLASGVYQYAVKRGYTNNNWSIAALSNTVIMGMEVPVTVTLTTNSNDPATGAVVTLTHVDGIHTYTMTYPENGNLIFPLVWKGTYTLSVSKYGYEPYHFANISVQATLTLNAQLIELRPPVVNVTGSISGNSVTLFWLPPNSGTAQWINWDSGENVDGIGTGGVVNFDVATRFEPVDLEEFNAMYLTKVKIFPREVACTYSIKVWQGGSHNGGFDPGSLLIEQTITNPIIEDWNEVVLTSPVLIDNTQELWIGYNVDAQTGYPAGCDAGPAVPDKGALMYFEGAWSNLTDLAPSLDYNWNIQGYVAYGGRDENSVSLGRNNSNKDNKRHLTGYKVLLVGQNPPVWEGTSTTCTFNYLNPDEDFAYIYAVYSSGDSQPVCFFWGSNSPEPDKYETAFKGNYPNPFNPSTLINYSVAKDQFVSIEIYNIKGQKVKTLVNESKLKGNHSVTWNGKDNVGKAVTSGIYFCRMQSGSFRATSKMILLK